MREVSARGILEMNSQYESISWWQWLKAGYLKMESEELLTAAPDQMLPIMK